MVAHELEHARSRQPLKLALVRVAARTAFWIPLVRDLAARYVLLVELEADRAAIRATSRSALAGALARVLDAQPAGAVGLGDHAAARVDRLVDPATRLPRLTSPARLAPTALAFAGLALGASAAPRPAVDESARLHAMSATLLAHHPVARLLGFVGTVAALAVTSAAARRLARRAGATGSRR